MTADNDADHIAKECSPGMAMRNLREARGLNLHELAGKISMHPTTLSHFEIGHAPLGKDACQAVAKALSKVSFEEVISGGQKLGKLDVTRFYGIVRGILKQQHMTQGQLATAMNGFTKGYRDYNEVKVQKLFQSQPKNLTAIKHMANALGYESGQELVAANQALQPATEHPKPKRAMKVYPTGKSNTKRKWLSVTALPTELSTDRWASMMTQIPQGTMTEEEMARLPAKKPEAEDHLKKWASYVSAGNAADRER